MEGLDASLVLIGGANSLHSDYYQECRKNAGEQVYFINWLDDDCLLASAYYNSQVFILPSYQEIFGNSLFEASMSGTNVISTQVLPLESWGISTMCASIDPNSIADIKAKLVEGLKKQKTEILFFRGRKKNGNFRDATECMAKMLTFSCARKCNS